LQSRSQAGAWERGIFFSIIYELLIMKKEQIIALRAGLFVLFMMIALAIAIFVLGTQKGYFKKQFTIYTTFTNVVGLQSGAPVRLAGVTVGNVIDVNIPEDLTEKKLVVAMQIEKRVQNRIRTDSVASIKWLSYVTGDPYIEVLIGSRNKPMVKEGEFIEGVDSQDYSKIFENGANVVGSLYKNLQKLEDTKLIETLSQSTKSLKEIIEEIKVGSGMLHSLIYKTDGKNLVDNVLKSSENLNRITQDIAGLTKEIDKITNQIKTGDGLLHAIIYDEEKRKILDDLAQATEDLKNVTEKIVEGEGSLGAIINDPDLYDNLNQLLGGANRSFILRTLIRRSIKKGASEELE
jgi:phospholipid/cholesterol/gamma-HCH transport system substrate-binding protein